MDSMRLGFRAGLLFFAVTSACGACSPKIQTPTIVTELVVIGTISPKGADIQATLDVTNPNTDAVTATGVQSKITIGDKPNVATASMLDPLILPGRSHTKPKIAITITWTDAAAINALAATKQSADYVVEGSTDFTNATGKTAKTPFTIRGVMSADQLAKAATGGGDAGAK
jgi:LEA14-like dessication related protein